MQSPFSAIVGSVVVRGCPCDGGAVRKGQAPASGFPSTPHSVKFQSGGMVFLMVMSLPPTLQRPEWHMSMLAELQKPEAHTALLTCPGRAVHQLLRIPSPPPHLQWLMFLSVCQVIRMDHKVKMQKLSPLNPLLKEIPWGCNAFAELCSFTDDGPKLGGITDPGSFVRGCSLCPEQNEGIPTMDSGDF